MIFLNGPHKKMSMKYDNFSSGGSLYVMSQHPALPPVARLPSPCPTTPWLSITTTSTVLHNWEARSTDLPNWEPSSNVLPSLQGSCTVCPTVLPSLDWGFPLLPSLEGGFTSLPSLEGGSPASLEGGSPVASLEGGSSGSPGSPISTMLPPATRLSSCGGRTPDTGTGH